MSRFTRKKAFAVCATAALVIAACGDDDDDDADDSTATTAAAPTTEAAPATAEPEATSAPATTEAVSETTAAPEASTAPEPPTGEPIKIGILTSITTNFAPWGLQVRDGAQLAVDDINAAGGVDGRPLELVIEDDQNAAEEAVPAFERLLEEGVVGIGGHHLEHRRRRGLSARRENQMPTFLVKSGAETILTPDSRYMFRTCLPAAPMVARRSSSTPQENGLTKIGAIVADYPWGHAFKGSIETAVAGAERHRAARSRRLRCPSRTSRPTCGRSTSSGPTCSLPPVIRREADRSSPSRTTSGWRCP